MARCRFHVAGAAPDQLVVSSSRRVSPSRAVTGAVSWPVVGRVKFPKPSGRSRHGQPARVRKKIPLITIR